MSQLTIDALRRAVQMVKDKTEKEEYMVVVNIDDLLQVLRELKQAGYKIGHEEGRKPNFFLISDGVAVMRLVGDDMRYTPRGFFLRVNVKKLGWPVSADGLTISPPDDT